MWIKDFFGDNIRKEAEKLGAVVTTETGLTQQQEDAIRKLDKFVLSKIKAHFGLKMTEEEIEYSQKIGISIMSGKGTGKDFWTALVACSFLARFEYLKGLATANTEKQLKNVLWSEFSKIISLSKKDKDGIPVLKHMIEVQSDKMYWKKLKDKKDVGKRWFIEAVTTKPNATKDEMNTSLGGRHERFQLFILDEASTLSDAVLEAIEGTLTGVLNILIVIFNPTRNKGFAYRSQYEDSKRWVTIRWNSEESEIYSKQQLQIMRDKYDEDSNPYRINIKGLPPLTDANTLFDAEWISEAIEKNIVPLEDDPVMVGVDVGAGGDKSVICIRQGGKVFKFKKINTNDTMILVQHIVDVIEEWKPKVVFVDTIGIGVGVYDRLRELGYRKIVKPGDVRRTADNPEKFRKKRDEIFWNLRVMFEEGRISIPNDQNVIDQLRVFNYSTETGKVVVDKKKTVKKELENESPDELDALALSCYQPDKLFRFADTHETAEELERKRGHKRRMSHYQEQGWMGC